MIRVAIDSGPLRSGHAVRGIGVHTRELLFALGQESNRAGKQEIKVDAFDFTDHRSLITGHYDIVHYPYFHPFFITLPFQKLAKKVIVTIHDLIPLIYPKHYPPGIKGSMRFLIQKFLLNNVDAIITISKTSKKDICRFLGVNPDKVRVVYLAPRKIFKPLKHDTAICITVSKRYSLPSRFVLYVGDINYNKNIPTLIKACKLAKIILVICGKQALDIEEQGIDLRTLTGPMDWLRFIFNRPHPELAHYKDLLKEFRNMKNVIRLGFVPEEDLVTIYNLATVYCQPSYYEGFGLPVLEAMACGCPVVASRTQALVEIAENSALFADRKNPKDMADKIRFMINDLGFRKEITRKGLERAKDFSWRKVAEETLKVYEEI